MLFMVCILCLWLVRVLFMNRVMLNIVVFSWVMVWISTARAMRLNRLVFSCCLVSYWVCIRVIASCLWSSSGFDYLVALICRCYFLVSVSSWVGSTLWY